MHFPVDLPSMRAGLLRTSERHARACAIHNRARSHGTFARAISKRLRLAGWGW